jgi:hypothetical protein
MTWAEELKKAAEKEILARRARCWPQMDTEIRRRIATAAQEGKLEIKIYIWPNAEHDAWCWEIKPRLEKDGLRCSDYYNSIDENEKGFVVVKWS